MSLINDALRRARQTQPAGSTAAAPALRPVEYTNPMYATGLLLPVLLCVVITVAVLLLWQWFHPPLIVRAKSIPAAEVSKTLPVPAPTPAATVVAPAVVNATVSSSPATAASNAVATVEPAKPQPPAYKLQSIFFRPKSPSAVINGKTLYLGDRVGDMRVAAIDEESAALVNSTGQTNVLELP